MPSVFQVLASDHFIAAVKLIGLEAGFGVGIGSCVGAVLVLGPLGLPVFGVVTIGVFEQATKLRPVRINPVRLNFWRLMVDAVRDIVIIFFILDLTESLLPTLVGPRSPNRVLKTDFGITSGLQTCSSLRETERLDCEKFDTGEESCDQP